MHCVYGVLSNGVHVDVSLSQRGAKNYATRNSFDVVTIRPYGDYHAFKLAKKDNKGRWRKAERERVNI